MRKYRFRAWDPDSKIMGISFDPFDPVFMSSGGTFDDNTIIMQSTGLKDQNGVEIFEGDVIRFKVDFEEQEFDNGVVRWAKGGYWTAQTEDDLEDLLSEELKDLDSEIIGNIYENPELLNP